MGGTFNENELRRFTSEVFKKAGLSKDDVEIFSDILFQANLEGLDSHGISKLPIYFKRLKEGRINPHPNIRKERTAPGILLMDGDNGPGPVVAKRSVDAAIEVAMETGISAVGVRNSNHFGPASYYCQQACSHQLVCITFTNAPPGIAPWGGKKPYFGTNPVAFGFPTGTDTPVIIDMSSSIVARGKIRLAAKNEQKIPEAWAIDQVGNPTTDAHAALKGSILPMGGAKGYALALAIEIISGLITGAAFGEDVQNFNNDNQGKANVGHFFIVLDIQKFMSLSVYEQLIQEMIEEIKQIPKAAGVEEILIPGERRVREANLRRDRGITISPSVIEELKQLARELGVSFMKSQQ